MVRRSFYLLSSTIGLLLLSPLLLSIAAAIKLGSPGPVFYRGQRVGRHGRLFRIFKFRSMVMNAESLGGPSTSSADARITRVGSFMRKFKLDELPQLINVFRGEMSLVGPRPEVQKYTDMYTTEQRVLLNLRPGITDWASIWNSDEGAVLALSDDPDRAYEEWIRPTKIQLQLAYARHNSLWVDLKIISFTLLKLVNKDFVPREIREVLASSDAPDLKALVSGRKAHADFSTVTELPGHGATAEQYSMLQTRYHLAAKLAAGKDVLELACGPGVGLGCLAQAARRVVAGDFDPTLVVAAARQYGSRVEVRQLDAQNLPFPNASFDVILLLEAIYYLPAPKRFVAEAKRVLRNDGQILICSANPERPDFNPSPFAHGYYTAAELRDLLAAEGFDAVLYGGYTVSARRLRDRILSSLRRFAVTLRLIPKTMAWKIRLKRLFFGPLKPIPDELAVRAEECEPIVRIDAWRPVRNFKVIYAIGRRAA
jgi:lipopolysaccharide/colanic/teichoic acid biosynthesis glycosyltransferase/SAM-dependent methyltransferase